MNIRPLKRNQLSKDVLSQIEFIERESEILSNYWRTKDMSISGRNKHKLEMLVQEYKKMIDIIDTLYNLPKREIPFTRIISECLEYNTMSKLLESPVTYERTLVIFYDAEAGLYLYY